MAKIYYARHKTGRIKGGAGLFCGVTSFDNRAGWWCRDKEQWVPSGSPLPKGGSTHFNHCYSVRAFRRRLREWSHYLEPGITFILASRFRGYDVYGTTTKPNK